MQLASDGDARGLRRELRRKCFSQSGGLYYFTKAILGYKELVPHFHLDFCDSIQNTIQVRKRGFLRPRGTFKSTIISKSYPLLRLAGLGSPVQSEIVEMEPDELLAFYKMYPEMDPRNLRIVIIGESDTVAQKNLKDPKWHLHFKLGQLF